MWFSLDWPSWAEDWNYGVECALEPIGSANKYTDSVCQTQIYTHSRGAEL